MPIPRADGHPWYVIIYQNGNVLSVRSLFTHNYIILLATTIIVNNCINGGVRTRILHCYVATLLSMTTGTRLISNNI